jgi:hypothetical protein
MSLTLLHRLAYHNQYEQDNNQLIHFCFHRLFATRKYQVGSAGFEPTTSGTQNPNHTKLDHDPDVNAQKRPQFKLLISYDDLK